MNNTTKEIEAGKVDSVSLCTVEMDGKVTKSDDFVAILSKEDGSASITYNTDALTLGMALKLVAVEYTRCLSECSEEEREAIKAALGDSYPIEAPEEENTNA